MSWGTWAAVCDRRDWFADVIRAVYSCIYFPTSFLFIVQIPSTSSQFRYAMRRGLLSIRTGFSFFFTF